MMKICVVTSSRADYGILRPLIARLHEDVEFDLRLVVTGMHLCPEFGKTYLEIEEDELPIHKKIDIQISSDETAAMSKSMGLAMICFADYFKEYTPDLLVVLGDRYEIMAVVCAAANQRIPIAHIHGGETTEGAVDEFFRHSITKMSALHFTSCEAYRKRVIQLGEEPNRVYNVGALSIENIMKIPLLSLDELTNVLGFQLEEKAYCVVTFHPVTLENISTEQQLKELMHAMDSFPQMKYIITKANSDAGGRAINDAWDAYVKAHENCLLVDSLGMIKFLSALKHAAAMIGNSSSGVTEGPASKIPVVDIGDRQKGRERGDSVIHCEPDRDDIVKAMQLAFSAEFRHQAKVSQNPFGDGDTSEQIVKIIREVFNSDISTKKKFYDVEFEV